MLTMLAREIKPFIDREYRTLKAARHTAIGGSSLGALAALVAGLEYPRVFGGLAILSPSVWWGRAVDCYRGAGLRPRLRPRVWLDVGTAEGDTPQSAVEDVRLLRGALIESGWREGAISNITKSKGRGTTRQPGVRDSTRYSRTYSEKDTSREQRQCTLMADALACVAADSNCACGGRLDTIPRAERRWRLSFQRSSGALRCAKECGVENGAAAGTFVAGLHRRPYFCHRVRGKDVADDLPRPRQRQGAMAARGAAGSRGVFPADPTDRLRHHQ